MELHYPIPGAPLSDGFGPRAPIRTSGGTSSSFHGGQDFEAAAWTPIHAAAGGTVTRSGRAGTLGYAVFLDHGQGFETVYAHMIEPPPVAESWHVEQGDVIGYVGSTGASTGPHLHFVVNRHGTPVNPMLYLTHPQPVTDALEATMTNPIVSVPDSKGTLYIGTDDGEFVQYDTPQAMNSRGIISHVFCGGPGGDKDTIPALGWNDFAVIRTVWRQMCGKGKRA